MASVTEQSAEELVRARLQANRDATAATLRSACVEQTGQVGRRIVESLTAGGKVLFFGNGGSAMDAGHLAEELLGHFYLDRPSLAAVSLADNTGAVTAISNDYDYSEVFERQLRALGSRGDVAVGLTTSGNSDNVVRALRAARELGILAVAMTGAAGGAAGDVADICIRVPSRDTPRVQEICLNLGHSICEYVERVMFARSD